MADCCKECSSSEAWDGERNHIKPLERKRECHFFFHLNLESTSEVHSYDSVFRLVVIYKFEVHDVHVKKGKVCVNWFLYNRVWAKFFRSRSRNPEQHDPRHSVWSIVSETQRWEAAANENHGKRTVQQFVQIKSRLVYLI